MYLCMCVRACVRPVVSSTPHLLRKSEIVGLLRSAGPSFRKDKWPNNKRVRQNSQVSFPIGKKGRNVNFKV